MFFKKTHHPSAYVVHHVKKSVIPEILPTKFISVIKFNLFAITPLTRTNDTILQ